MRQEDLKPYSKVRDLFLTLDGTPLICNRYMSLNNDFFYRIISSPDEKELVVIHPGTDRILSSAIVCAAFSCIFNGTIDPKEHYKQFIPDDIVIRNGERYRFAGIKDGMCVLASDDTSRASNTVTKIPLKRGLDIRPYFGSSIRTGRQGAVRSHLDANEYLQRIVGEQYRDQAITMPLCTLIVCSREKAQYIADNLLLVDGDCSYRFADAFPFAWVHAADNFEVLFGAVGKPEPALLFTNRISLARELLFEDFDYQKRVSAIILHDVDPNAAPVSELYDIKEQINRRKNGRLITIQSVGKVSEAMSGIIGEKAQTVFWSSDVLLSTIDDLYHEPRNPADQIIMAAINRTIDNSVERIVIPSSAALTDLKVCKTLLKRLIRLKSHILEVDEFILCTYELLNLFEQAAFTMGEYEDFITKGRVEARSPKKQIEKLYALPGLFDDANISDMAESISLLLAEAYSALYDANPKREALLRYVTEAREAGKSFYIIVPKRSYADVVGEICGCTGNEAVSIPGRVPHNIDVERLIITATPNVKKDGYNPLAGRTANETVLFEYESEVVKNNCYQRMIDRAFAPIKSSAKRSAAKLFGMTVESEDFAPDAIYNNTELDEAERIEVELTNIEIETVLGCDVDSSQPSSTPIHAIRLAQFDTGEWAMFSQYYTVYVFDTSAQKLIEKSPVDLNAGDTVVFSAAGSEITDFVDEILKQLILRDKNILEEHYIRSRRWKQVLSDYIDENSLTYQNISDRMRDCGYPRHPATIGTWLHEDSKIIGPRDVDTFIAIGLAADNDEIVDNARFYKRSCDTIRTQRMKILGYVQSIIIHSAENRGEEAEDTSLSGEEKSYLGDVGKYTRKLTIERIVPCERDVPAYLVNRPIRR